MDHVVQQWARAKLINGHYQFWFFDPVYGENFYLIWPVNNEQRKRWIKDKFGVDDFKSGDVYDGRVTEILPDQNSDSRKVGQVIALRKWEPSALWYGMLAHESFHAACNVLSGRGVTFGNSIKATNEPHAYYLQFIFGECVRGLHSVRIRNVNRKNGHR